MVHFSQSLMPDVPLATSLPTTFTFQPNNQIDEQSTLQQQSIPSSSQSHQQRSSSNDEPNNNNNHQTHPNDYETRLR
jgi:cytoskeletal protein RodZ